VPAGQYLLDGASWRHVVDNRIDAIGDGPGTSIEVRDCPLTGGAGSVELADMRFHGDGMANLMDLDASTVTSLGFEARNVQFDGVGGPNYGNEFPPAGRNCLDYLKLTDVSIDRAHRPLVVIGGIRRFEIERVSVDHWHHLGVALGGQGRRSQDRMEGGTIRNLSVGPSSTLKVGGINNALWINGRNVELYDCDLYAPQQNGGTDNENLYTKVIDLRASKMRLFGGGNLAAWSCKGDDPFDGDRSTDGYNTLAEDFLFDRNGQAGSAGTVWFQSHGPSVFRNFTVRGMAGVAFRMHASVVADVVLDNWDIRNHAVPRPPKNPGLIYLAGAGTIDVRDCTIPVRAGSSAFRNKPPGLALTQTKPNRFYS
jgi:hypothetical protein